jgi:hypothetical protein
MEADARLYVPYLRDQKSYLLPPCYLRIVVKNNSLLDGVGVCFWLFRLQKMPWQCVFISCVWGLDNGQRRGMLSPLLPLWQAGSLTVVLCPQRLITPLQAQPGGRRCSCLGILGNLGKPLTRSRHPSCSTCPDCAPPRHAVLGAATAGGGVRRGGRDEHGVWTSHEISISASANLSRAWRLFLPNGVGQSPEGPLAVPFRLVGSPAIIPLRCVLGNGAPDPTPLRGGVRMMRLLFFLLVGLVVHVNAGNVNSEQ